MPDETTSFLKLTDPVNAFISLLDIVKLPGLSDEVLRKLPRIVLLTSRSKAGEVVLTPILLDVTFNFIRGVLPLRFLKLIPDRKFYLIVPLLSPDTVFIVF
jgi:hypothetical protein